MNPRIVLLLIRTDFRRLWWLFALAWLLMLAVAWPGLTFTWETWADPKRILGDYNSYAITPSGKPFGIGHILHVYAHQVLNLAVITSAAMIGIHAVDWTASRPLRAWDLIVSKTLLLLVVLVLPLVGLSVLNLAVHRFPASDLLETAWLSTRMVVPRLLAACLLGCICGRFWRWVAAMVGFLAMVSIGVIILPFFGIGLTFVTDPFGIASTAQGSITLWIGVLVLAVFLRFGKKRLRPNTGIVTALVLLLACSSATVRWAFRVPRIYKPASTPAEARESTKGLYTELGPDLSPTLTNGSLPARITEIEPPPVPFQPGPLPRIKALQIQPDISTNGTPDGWFTSWERLGDSTLSVDGRIIAKGIRKARPQSPPGYYSTSESLLASFPTGATFFPQDRNASPRVMSNYPNEVPWADHLEPILPDYLTNGTVARFSSGLVGTVFRYETLVDLPISSPARLNAGGVRMDVSPTRYLPNSPSYKGPMVQVLQMVHFGSDSGGMWPTMHYLPPEKERNIGFIYLPATRQIVSCQRYDTRCILLAGCASIRTIWAADRLYDPKNVDLTGARFVLLRPVFKGFVFGKVEDMEVKLSMEERKTNLPTKPFRLRPFASSKEIVLSERPDPLTSTPEDYWRWVIRSYADTASGLAKRDAVEFLPRQLPWLLRAEADDYRGFAMGALLAAMPESRKGEFLTAAEESENLKGSTWLLKIAMQRGWTNDLKPMLRRMVTDDANRGELPLLALASLEDPATYPDILQRVKDGVDIETDQMLRRVPGLEPGLTEAVREAWERAKQRSQRDHHQIPSSMLQVAATHGVREAFERMFARWSQVMQNEPYGVTSGVFQVLMPPESVPEGKDPVSLMIEGRTATDFHWDAFTRRWTLNSTK
ncbi:hypothetical protein KBB96_02215 [Luteolibacter ambystomatis]|uniref:Uncharacterized protein n=1 Tax=Luteolibacter ambystomatis TaxID=2824561 RepID=A0A975PEY2_9BACT|nr:hypothetical protein [Luteolibacter ambystomatis]QUE51714.1 hypothetical protein KBB96_02215 [Luteolibacter ambystomatis]